MHYRYAANEQRGVADVPAGATVENAYLFAPYPLPIFGVDTRIVREAPGACAAVGGDVTLTAELPYLRSTAPESPPETLNGCFAGPDTAAAERRFLQVVETADDGTNERILPTFLSAVGAAVAVWLLGRRREGSGDGGDDA